MNKLFELLNFLILSTQGGTKWKWDDKDKIYTYCGTNDVTVRIKRWSDTKIISLFVGPFCIEIKDFPIIKEKLDLLYSEIKYGDNRSGLEELIEKVILDG